MLGLICTDRPIYIKTEIEVYGYKLCICTSCGNMVACMPRNTPKGTKFIQYICRSCVNERRIPQNLRMNKLFYQYYDSNWNLLYEREAEPWRLN